jgi:hypothetical protein
MNVFDYPPSRDPFNSSPRFDPFALFAFCSVIVLFGAMCLGIYAGPLGGTRGFELPDVFGTKAQDQAQKLLQAVPLSSAKAGAQPTPTVVASGTTGDAARVSASVPAEAAEAAIAVPWGMTMSEQVAAPPTAVPAAPPASTEPQIVQAVEQHAVGSRHKVTGTNGDGVFIRRTPRSADRIVAWPDNAVMEYQGEQSQNEGITWAKMKDPKGNVGWVPVQYLTPANDPPAPAAPPVPPAAPAPAQSAPAAPAPPAPAAPAVAAPGVQVVPPAPVGRPGVTVQRQATRP